MSSQEYQNNNHKLWLQNAETKQMVAFLESKARLQVPHIKTEDDLTAFHAEAIKAAIYQEILQLVLKAPHTVIDREED